MSVIRMETEKTEKEERYQDETLAEKLMVMKRR